MVTPGSRGISRAPRYSGAHRESVRFRVLGCHHLWPTIPGRSSNLLISYSPGIRQVPRRVLQPRPDRGLPPIRSCRFRLFRFRSPLLTESLRFPFLRVLRCFSSPAYLLTAYRFSSGSPGITLEGLPHSDIPGSQPAGDSPGLFAAIHVLHRLLVPRHPPCALASSASRSLDHTKPAGSTFSIKKTFKSDQICLLNYSSILQVLFLRLCDSIGHKKGPTSVEPAGQHTAFVV